MATIVTDILCDLTQPVKVQYLHGNLFSQDNAANTINVHVHSAGVPESLGGTISANVIRSDGGTVAVAGSVSGDTATVVLPQACYAVPGVIHIIIKSTVSSVVTTIAAVVANVYTSSTDTVVDPGTIITDVAALIAEIEEAVDSIPVDYSGLLATIAADYSSSKTYPVVGTYAWQGGVLKRNIVPITTAESYTAAHWTNAVLGDDVSDLKSAINAQIVPATWNPGLTKKEHYKISDGLVESHNKYVRTTSLWNGYRSRIAILLNDTDYEYVITYYDATGAVYLGHDTMASGLHYIPEIAAKFGISFRRVDQVNVTDSDVTAIDSALSCYTPTDTTLTQQGMAADAKSVKEALVVTEKLFSLSTASNIIAGRLGTQGGVNSNILWCARTETLKSIPGNASSMRISCDGYLIRLLMYSSASVTSSNVPLWYNSDFEEGPIQYNIVNGALYYGINIRKNPSSETALTSEDIEDIASKLKIYFDTALDKIQAALDTEVSERKQADDNIVDNIVINNPVGNLNIVVGRLGTSGGVSPNILWCARTKELNQIFYNPSLIRVSCPGYYVRLLQYEKSGTELSNVPVAYTANFEENSILATVNPSAKYYGINIRKNMDDSYVLTDEDIDDISSKLIIKDNGGSNDALILNAKYSLGGVSFFPNPFYTTEYTAELIQEFGSSNTATQGMCGDGHRYVWITGRKNNSDTAICNIYKYDIVNKCVAKVVSEREYGHANDMAFVPDTNEIHILSWHTDDDVLYENGGTVDRISVIDADTLLFKYEYGLNSIIGADTGYYRLSAIAYNPCLRQFAGLLSAHNVGGVSVRSLVRWTLTNQYIDHHDGLPIGTASGMDYDNNYLYLLLGYRLYYFDLRYNQIGNTTYKLPFAWSDSSEHLQEAESVSVFFDAVYINTNNLNDPDSNPKTRLYRLAPLYVQFLTT